VKEYQMPLGLFMQMRTVNKGVNFALKFQGIAEKMANKFKILFATPCTLGAFMHDAQFHSRSYKSQN